MPLRRALLVIIVFILAVVAAPAAAILDHRLAAILVRRAHDELAAAPRVFADQRAALSEAMMMHAKELAHVPGLAAFMQTGDREHAQRLVDRARQGYADDAILVTARHGHWSGPQVPGDLLEATQHGEMPVAVVRDGLVLENVAVAPVMQGTVWVGAAGVSTKLDEVDAERLAGLSRNDVVIVAAGRVMTSTTRVTDDAAIATELAEVAADSAVHEIVTADGSILAIAIAATADARVIFVRDLHRELALLPQLRGIAAAAGLAALALAVLLGAVLADAVSRPVRNLARAADNLAQGDFEVPLGSSRLTEVTRLAGAFAAMRRALQARVRELEERQVRLAALQADLIQRDRLATAGRLVVQLAHEIRNPVANIRNCLELILRHRALDTPTRAYAVMASGELSRLHTMAEHLLDLHRPRWEGGLGCNAVGVACDVADLLRLGPAEGTPSVTVAGSPNAGTAISADALKQVLENVCQNAREAMPNGGAIHIQIRRDAGVVIIEVSDTGPGIPADLLGRIFDPFFTTKRAVDGVGLGLFVASGIIRSHGGTITAANHGDGEGARFLVTLPAAPGATEPPLRSFGAPLRAVAEARS